MIITTDNTTYGALNAVQSLLREIVNGSLGSELSDADFNTVAGFEAQLSEILKKELV